MAKSSVLREKMLALLEEFEVSAVVEARAELMARLDGPAKKISAPKTPPQHQLPLEKISANLLSYIEKNPGRTITEIAADLNSDVDSFRTPLRKLFETKKVVRKGEGRGVRYTIKK